MSFFFIEPGNKLHCRGLSFVKSRDYNVIGLDCLHAPTKLFNLQGGHK